MAAQLDLFAWATPRRKMQRIGWENTLVVCQIGVDWWFAPYLVMPDETGKIVPDLKASLLPRFHQERA